MTFVKYALLGGVALAAVTLNARAEDVDALNAKLEALELRLSQYEENATTAKAPSANVPSAMTMAKAPQILAPGEKLRPSDAAMANTISILPTADIVDGGEPGVPSSAAAQWTGHVKAALVYQSFEIGSTSTDSTHIVSNAELNLKAINDTAVGEVGVHVRFAAEADGHSLSDGGIDRAYGWWKMTPEMTLKAGYKNSIGGVGHGMDKCECHYTDIAGVVGGLEDDATQFEIRYASGPMELAVALEHRDFEDNVKRVGDVNDYVGYGQTYLMAAEAKWSGDSVSAEVSGYWGEMPVDTAATAPVAPSLLYTGDVDTYYDTAVDVWQIGAGASFGLDAFTISAAAGYGEVEGFGYWESSVLASVALSDSISAEAGAGYSKASDLADWTVMGVAGGVYWSPADKLTIGAEGSWKSESVADITIAEGMKADLVTVFKF